MESEEPNIDVHAAASAEVPPAPKAPAKKAAKKPGASAPATRTMRPTPPPGLLWQGKPGEGVPGLPARSLSVTEVYAWVRYQETLDQLIASGRWAATETTPTDLPAAPVRRG
jgi:hypothetical protein